MSPTEGLDGVTRMQVVSVGVDVPDSLKQALGLADQLAGSSLSAPMGPVSRNMLVSAAAALSSASCGGGGLAGYTQSKVAFAPEEIPNIAPQGFEEDKYIPDSFVPLGFSFNFHGNNYDRVNVYTNGFLLFGTPPATPSDGFFRGGVIHSPSNPNNIIAFGWADWSPHLVPDGIRFETRGAAPHRRFILQFTNVPEYNSVSKVGAIKAGVGRLMAQVVLSEGTNEITIYTNTMTLTNSINKYTQGIENAAGTEAKYDSIQNPTTLVWSARVNKFFMGIKLTNDAVRFSPNSAVSDKELPSITAPANITDKHNDPGLASAVVAVGSPVYSDNCIDVTVSSVRSDGVTAIDAPYPVGTTTITWTAKDAAGNTASATQSVTVLDKEAPVFGPSAQSVIKVNATTPAGAVVTYSVNASDNVGVTSLTCEPASGSVFAVGPKKVDCSARDAAGNSSSQSLSVIVVDAHTQLGDLLAYVRSLPLADGTKQPLINQLRSAYKEQGNECKKMADFIHLVKTKKIDDPFAGIMTVRAAEIRGAWGCEGAEPPPVSGSSQLRTSQRAF